MPPVVVIDSGTAFIKMGFAGNGAPTHVIPSLIAQPGALASGNVYQQDPFADLDFAVGEEAVDRVGSGWHVSSPISHGTVVDWDSVEKLWQHCIYKYLRVEPEETGFLLVEPPAAPLESREYTAEIMFETFGVRSLHMAMQGPLALRASWGTASLDSSGCEVGADTGLVIDSGAEATHIVPVVNGCVMEHAIRRIPVAGRAITERILHHLRDRGEPLEAGHALTTAQRIKERYGCVRPTSSLDSSAPVPFLSYREPSRGMCGHVDISVGCERFTAPELLFRPDSTTAGGFESLPEAVDTAIWRCPIDARRPLYQNMVLAGGTTMLSGFARRLQAELRALADRRAQGLTKAASVTARGSIYDVRVVTHAKQRYAAWCGGSMLGASPAFSSVAKTRQQYAEEGPRIMRECELPQLAC